MKYSLFTDGACQPNPGDGGWAFIAYQEGHSNERIVKSGYKKETTNNRMELMAAFQGLKHICNSINLGSDNTVLLISDSKYVLNGIKSWMKNWSQNNWIKKNKKSVLNSDLWKEIYFYSQKISIECEYIPGHSGHSENEECDKLAVKQISKNKEL